MTKQGDNGVMPSTFSPPRACTSKRPSESRLTRLANLLELGLLLLTYIIFVSTQENQVSKSFFLLVPFRSSGGVPTSYRSRLAVAEAALTDSQSHLLLFGVAKAKKLYLGTVSLNVRLAFCILIPHQTFSLYPIIL